MIKLAGTWHIKAGDDVEAIDRHYYDVHVPNVRRLPRLARHVIGVALQDAAGGNPACYRTAETWWKTREDFEADMASEEWQTIADDGFMPMVAGLEIVVYEVETEWTPEDDS